MADDSRNIDDLINESFSDDFGDFDPGSWDELNSRLEASAKGIDKLVFEAHIPVEAVPDESVWEGIQDALDVQTVWERIQQKWNSSLKYGWYKIAGLFLLFILISLPLGNNSFQLNYSSEITAGQDDSETNITSNESNQLDGKKVLVKNTKEVSEYNSTNEEIYRVSNSSINKNPSLNTGVLGQNADQKASDQNQSLKLELDKIEPRYSSLTASSANILAAMSQPEEIISPNEEKSKWTIGFLTEINDTWIMDAETRSGFLENSLVYNDISFAPSYGVFVNYNLNGDYVIGSDIYFSSNLKTKNNLYKSGKLVSKETELSYFKTSLSLGKKLKKSFVVKAGPYLSYLRHSSVSFDGVITEYNSSFNTLDYGLQFNINREHDINAFYLAYGLNSSVGINNVFDGLNKPAYLNQTRNFTIGVNLRLGYNF